MDTGISQAVNVTTGSNTQAATQTQGSQTHHGSVVNTIEAPVEANHASQAQKGAQQGDVKSESQTGNNRSAIVHHFPDQNNIGTGKERMEQDLEKQMEKVRDHFSSVGRNLEFSVDKDSERLVVKVVDPVTKETIRQIPSESFMEMSERLEEARGNLLDSKV